MFEEDPDLDDEDELDLDDEDETDLDAEEPHEPGACPVCVAVDAQIERDGGMTTVEYAVGTVVAAAFAAVLYRIVTGDSVVAGLTSLVNSALKTAF